MLESQKYRELKFLKTRSLEDEAYRFEMDWFSFISVSQQVEGEGKGLYQQLERKVELESQVSRGLFCFSVIIFYEVASIG